MFDRAIASAPMRMLFKGLLSDGVSPDASRMDADISSKSFMVSSGSGMTVTVNKGFAICGGCLKYLEADENLTLLASHTSLPRIDSVALRLNDNDSERSCELVVLNGTPATNPVRPELTRSGSIYEIAFADIYIPAKSTVVSNEYITDTRLDSTRCGLINAIDSIDVTEFTHQLQAELNKFINEYEADFTEWSTIQKTEFENWENNEEESFSLWSSEARTEFETWSDKQKADFMIWFNNLQVILDENVAARLTAEVEALKTKDTEIEGQISELSDDVDERIAEVESKIEGGIPSKTSDLENDGGGEPQKRGTIPNTYKFNYPNIFLTEASITRNEGMFYEVGTAHQRIRIKLKNTDIVNVYCNKYGVNPNSVVVEQEGDYTDIIASFEPSVVADTSFKVIFEVIFIDNLN